MNLHTQSQAHGFTFEDNMKIALYPTAPIGNYLSPWDIEAENNPENLPVSMKVSGSNEICLSSALAFLSITEPYRIELLQYKQVDNMKVPARLIRALIMPEEHKKLIGNLTPVIISDFDKEVKQIKIGDHEAGREFAKNKGKHLKEKYGSLITLNSKIGASDNQRRVQASLLVRYLLEVVENCVCYDAVDGIVNVDGKRIEPIHSPIRFRKSKAVNFVVITGGKIETVADIAETKKIARRA